MRACAALRVCEHGGPAPAGRGPGGARGQNAEGRITGEKRGSGLQQSTGVAVVPAGGTGGLSPWEPGHQTCLA